LPGPRHLIHESDGADHPTYPSRHPPLVGTNKRIDEIVLLAEFTNQ
jgi:hypothetical protein